MLAICYADNVALLVPSSSALLAICMLSTWVSFAASHHLIFNITRPSFLDLLNFTLLMCHLPLSFSFLQILTFDLNGITSDMCRKTNYCMLHLFPCCDPVVKTHLFASFCLSLSICVRYGHFLITVDSVAMVNSIYNIVFLCTNKLLATTYRPPSPLITNVFIESSQLAITFII